jgi:NADPH:quinone reductase-like Zn-dependent oxidoreductase
MWGQWQKKLSGDPLSSESPYLAKILKTHWIRTSLISAYDGLAVDFVVESDRAQLSEIVQRVRDGRLRTNIGNVSTLDDAVAAFNQTANTPII